MNDLKAFFKKREEEYGDIVWTNFFMDSNYAIDNPSKIVPDSDVIDRKELGEFFWHRGGKWFFENYDSYMTGAYCGMTHPTIRELKRIAKQNKDDAQVQDFLDALACLGEEQIKALILKVVKQ